MNVSAGSSIASSFRLMEIVFSVSPTSKMRVPTPAMKSLPDETSAKVRGSVSPKSHETTQVELGITTQNETRTIYICILTTTKNEIAS